MPRATHVLTCCVCALSCAAAALLGIIAGFRLISIVALSRRAARGTE
jgi:hypothetical protein